jgi:imidazolonepropionase-like amidohydrolase
VDAGQGELTELRTADLRVVEAVHACKARVTATCHVVVRCAGSAPRRRVDSIEHGFELDADVARLMAECGVALVTTLTVLQS